MTRAINYRELKRRTELDGARATCQHLREALDAKQLDPQDFSLRELAEATVTTRDGTICGRDWVREMDPRRADGGMVLEASDGVDSTMFANITGQIVYSAIMQAYQQEAFVFGNLIPTISTRLDGEKIPGIGQLGDEAEVVGEGMPYPAVGLGEDYVETPSTTKRGLIVPVTKEAIFFDRTNLVLSRCSKVGEWLGVNKEKRLCDLVSGYTNNYKWKGTTYDTYSIDGSTGQEGGTAIPDLINSIASNELIDWTDVDAVEQLFVNMLDPDTGEPIIMTGSQVVVMPAKVHAANRVFNATQIVYGAGGSTTATSLTYANNPLATNYTLYKSSLLYRRILATVETTVANAKNMWFMGDFRKAFAYMENWPITVTQAPQNSEAEFNQDIVAQFKASERGAAAVINPRYSVKAYQTSE